MVVLTPGFSRISVPTMRQLEMVIEVFWQSST
jgi:hypothetical protein